ncbi:MAG: hypothetical protein K6U87_15420 [Firmicutes bacterium]|nr:hypothetical protein [Bacillota bacterium]
MALWDDDRPAPCAVCGAEAEGICDACGRPFCEEHGFHDREGQPCCHACEEARYEAWRKLYESGELDRLIEADRDEAMRHVDWSKTIMTLEEYEALKGWNPHMTREEAREAILRRAAGRA